MKLKSVIALALALVMCLACFAGCAPSTASTPELASGGILCLSVNPEIAVHFDKDGNVEKVEARNDDGSAILADYSGYEGKPTRQVVTELVTAIGEAGYFVDDIDGERRHITIEIETGSKLPSDTFLDDVANDVRECVNSNNWSAPVNIRNDDQRTCTNPHCDDDDCDDLVCDDGICTNPYCDDDDCDDIDCDDDDRIDDNDDDGICTNPYCDDDDCDDIDCDDDDRIDDNNDDGICTNPFCDDYDCDDTDCDDDDREDDKRTCTNPYCDDDDCDDTDCDEDDDD